MKIEFPGHIHNKQTASEQNSRSEKPAVKPFDSGIHSFPDSSSATNSKPIRSDSIMRLDVTRQIVPMKASDVLTAGEMEMLEKLFHEMRLAKGSGEYGKK